MPTQLNSVSASDIEALEQNDLVALLRILLACEARDQIAATHVPSGITVSDDGEDGRWDGAAVPPFMPTPLTVFQVKATNFGPTDCYDEIFVNPPPKKKKSTGATAGKKLQAKAVWKEIVKRKATFIFFCRQEVAHSGKGGTHGITARLDQARAALKECGINIKPKQVDFFDGNKISVWANKFVAAIAYIHFCLRKAGHRRGRTWLEWQRDPSVQVGYCPNPKLDMHILTLRQALATPGQVGRVSGLSGLGKTRLAFEVFRPPAPGATSRWAGEGLSLLALSESMVYLDAEYASADVIGIVDDYEKAGLRGTVVVDNCERLHHNALAEIVKRTGCKLSLLTLDYEPEYPSPGETGIRLDPETMEPSVIEILKTHPKLKRLNLSEHAIDHIAKSAQGFPFLAVMIAESGEALNMERLNQAGVIKKLVAGHAPKPDPTALKVLKALSLFYHVGYANSVEAQAEFVRETLCPGVLEADFREWVKHFLKKRIIQPAGHFIFVSPPPLAVALAAEWWESAGQKQWNNLRPLIEKHKMEEPFARRFKQLSFSENAAALVAQLCGTNGPFADAKLLNSKSGSQIFRAIAEVNPMAAAQCLHRAFAKKSVKSLRDVTEGRRELVWALEKLCWSPDTFPLAAEIMLDFAAAEIEHISNNATGQFCQLYQVYLAGTQVPARDRLGVIRDGLASGVAEKRKVCIAALAAALQSQRFSRSGGVEVRGSSLPEKDWSPANRNEIFEYWREAAELLASIALSKSDDAEEAKKALGRQLRQIIWAPTVDWLEPLVFQIADKYKNFWPGALQSIKFSLEHDKDHHVPASRVRVASWVSKLTPSAPADRLRQLVTQAPHDHKETSPGKWEDISAQKAEALAVEFAENLPSLPKLLTPLLKGDQRQAATFGIKLGSLAYRRQTFVRECLTILKKLPLAEQNLDLLGGYLRGLNDRKMITVTLDALARTPSQQHLVPRLTRFIYPDKADLERVVKLISPKGLSPDVLRSLAYGSVLIETAPADLVAVLKQLTRRMKAARAVVIELLHLYVHHDKPKWEACSGYIRTLIASPGVIALCRNSSVSFAVQEFTTKLLSSGQDEAFARLLTKEIIAANEGPLSLGTDPFVNHILGVLVCEYPQVAWSLLGEELIAGKSIRFLVGRNSFTSSAHPADDKHPEVTGCLLDAVPAAIMLKWAKLHRKYVHKLLDLFSLFVQVGETDDYNWNDTVAKLVDIHFDEKCEQAIGSNLMSFGSVGSRVPYLNRRIRLLAKWATHPNPKVREMVQRQTGFLENDKKREAANDAHFAAGIRHA